jgi:hypothetical protein
VAGQQNRKKKLVALPGMEPRISNLPGRGLDAPKVNSYTQRDLNASTFNRCKCKKIARHESAWESALKLHGNLILLGKICGRGRMLFNTGFVSGRFCCTMIRH